MRAQLQKEPHGFLFPTKTGSEAEAIQSLAFERLNRYGRLETPLRFRRFQKHAIAKSDRLS